MSASASKKKKTGSRTLARRLAMQATYQWLMSGEDAAEIGKQFKTDPEARPASQEYFDELFSGVTASADELAVIVSPLLNRPFDEVDPVERAILLIAAFELQRVLSIPYRAVINEAVELAKTYGAEQGHRFINGVLDKLAGQLRATEVEARKEA